MRLAPIASGLSENAPSPAHGTPATLKEQAGFSKGVKSKYPWPWSHGLRVLCVPLMPGRASLLGSSEGTCVEEALGPVSPAPVCHVRGPFQTTAPCIPSSFPCETCREMLFSDPSALPEPQDVFVCVVCDVCALQCKTACRGDGL